MSIIPYPAVFALIICSCVPISCSTRGAVITLLRTFFHLRSFICSQRLPWAPLTANDVCMCGCHGCACRYQQEPNALLVYFDRIAWVLDVALEPAEGFYYTVEISTGMCISVSERHTGTIVLCLRVCSCTLRPCPCALWCAVNACKSGARRQCAILLPVSLECGLSHLRF